MIRRLGLATVLLLAGCASNPQRLFVLSPPAEPRQAVSPETTRPEFYLRPVVVPDFLDTTDILLRRGPNEITPSPTGRWGERLSDGITQALAAALGAPVMLDPAATGSARQIVVTVEAFDVQPNGACVLTAHWTIGNARGRATVVTAGAAGPVDDAAIAAAMSATVVRLADAIAKASMGLRAPNPRTGSARARIP